MADVSDALKKKIIRRSKRAFAAFDAGDSKKIHRITDITATSLTYRLPHASGQALRAGEKVVVQRVGKRVTLAGDTPVKKPRRAPAKKKKATRKKTK